MWIFNVNRANAFSFNTDEELFKIIMDMENTKLLENHPEFGQTSWSFIMHPPQHVAALYHSTPKIRHSRALKAAYSRSLPLIEICTGDYADTLEIVADDSVKLDKLKKQWCLDYCQAHGYDVIENTQTQVHHATLPASRPDIMAS